MIDSEVLKQRDLVAQVYREGKFEVMSTEYIISKVTHATRTRFLVGYMEFAGNGVLPNFKYLITPEFDKLVAELNSILIVNGQTISKQPNYWDNHSEHYLKVISMAMAAIAYPLFSENPTN